MVAPPKNRGPFGASLFLRQIHRKVKRRGRDRGVGKGTIRIRVNFYRVPRGELMGVKMAVVLPMRALFILVKRPPCVTIRV
jgi:hypothetical protein